MHARVRRTLHSQLRVAAAILVGATLALLGAGAAEAAPATLSSAGENASSPQVAVAGDGSATVVWLQASRVQAVRISSSGTAGVVTDISVPGESASGPQVAVGADGIATIVWSGAAAGSNGTVQAVRFGPSGVVGSPKTLSDPNGSSPQVAVSGEGTATVTWNQYVPIPDSQFSQFVVQAARLSADGTVGGVSTLTGTAEASLTPDVAVDSDGVATIVWLANSQVKARRFDASGPVGSETLLSSGFDAGAPQVAVGTDGAATVTWATSATPSKVKAVRWEKLGSTSAIFDLSDPTRSAASPRIAAGPAGVATIGFYQSDGTKDRVQLVRLGSSGPAGTAANLSAAGQNASNPQVAVGGDGTTTVVWRRSDGTTNRAQAVRVAADLSVGSVLDLSAPGQAADSPQVGIGSQGPGTATWTRSDGTNSRVQAGPVAAFTGCDPNCTWTVGATGGTWSTAGNWSGSNAPIAGSNKSIVFPPRSPSCGSSGCPSNNDLTGVSADSMTIDNSSSYQITGNRLTLGAGGVSTTASGSASERLEPLDAANPLCDPVLVDELGLAERAGTGHGLFGGHTDRQPEHGQSAGTRQRRGRRIHGQGQRRRCDPGERGRDSAAQRNERQSRVHNERR